MDEFGEACVCFLADQHVRGGSHEDGPPHLPSLFADRLPFLVGRKERRLGGVDELFGFDVEITEARGKAEAMEAPMLLIVLLEAGVEFGIELLVVGRHTKVRCTLEHGQVSCLFCDLGDRLDRGGARPYHADALAREVDRLVGPLTRLESAPLEGVHPLDFGD